MRDRIEAPAGVTLIGAPFGADQLDEALARAPTLICADGGANVVGNRTPAAVIGDLDSLEGEAGWRAGLGDRLIRVEEQDSTDFEKCLARIGAPFFIGAGFLGGRLDHTLAALHALVAEPRPVVLIGAEDVVFAAGRSFSLHLEVEDRVSIFPMRPVKVLSSAGLRWSADGLDMAAGDRVGTSNEALGGAVDLAFDAPGAVILLARGRLDAALDAARGRT